MKPKKSIASLLPLLSAFTAVGFHHTRVYESLSNQISRTTENEQCQDYNEIVSWMEKQTSQISSFSNFQTNLSLLLNFFNERNSLKKCCLYDKNSLNVIIELVNYIDESTGILEPTGELGKDLENILSKVKNIVASRFKACCKNLQDLIQKLKVELKDRVQDRLQIVKGEVSKNFKEKTDLQEKLKVMENQIEDLKPRLETLKTQTGGRVEITLCCAELKEKIQDMDDKIRIKESKREDQAQKLNNQLKEIKDNQRNNDDLTTSIEKTIRSSGDKTKNTLEKCNRICMNENRSDKLKLRNEQVLNEKKKLEKLHKQVEQLFNVLVASKTSEPSTNLNKTLTNCLENCKKLTSIQIQLKSLLKEKIEMCVKCSSNKKLKNNLEALLGTMEGLSKGLKKTPNCDQKIDELSQEADQLQTMLKNINQTYSDFLKLNTNKFKEIKDKLDETLNKVANTHQPKYIDGLKEQVENLKKKLDKPKLIVKILQEKQDEFLNNKKRSNKQKNLSDEFKNLKNDFDEFKNDVSRQLSDLKRLKNGQSSFGKVHLEELEQLNNEIGNNLKKAKKKVIGNDEVIKQVKDEMEEQKTKANQMFTCQKKCSIVNKMDDLIDRVEDLEKKNVKPKNPKLI